MKSRVKRLGAVDWTAYEPFPVVGVDEVGRGCLAGPVVAAAVILSRPQRGVFFDSKVLSEKRREELLIKIQMEHRWCVGFASVEEIDRLNIYHASLLAMRRAVHGLRVELGHALIDGKALIPKLKVGIKQTALVRGDSRAAPISAASIVAKVTRDRFMKELAQKVPGYGFEIHKGYATKFHRARLAELGPCDHHRRHFNGCQAVEAQLAE